MARQAYKTKALENKKDFVLPYEGFKFRCSRCGKEYEAPEKYFYKNIASKRFVANCGFTTICKDCVQEYFLELAARYNDERLAAAIACSVIDIVFDNKLYDMIIDKNVNFTMGMYVRNALSMSQYMKRTFVYTLVSHELDRKKAEIMDEEESEWDEASVQNREDVIRAYNDVDPFSGYPVADRRFLFNELVQYLDDDTSSDAYKLSVLKQLCVNTLQISKYDKLISGLNPLTDADQIGNMQGLKNDLVTANDKLTKENEISVKNRSNKQAGKGSLTGLMRELRDKSIKGNEANFYDMLYSPGSKWAMDMSAASIREHAFFDENDINDIMMEQREKIIELQKRVDDLEEERRLFLIKEEESNADALVMDVPGE